MGVKSSFLIKNGQQIPIGFAMAEDWNLFSQEFFLQKGANTLGVNSSWGNMDIDYMQVLPFNVKPKVSPLMQTIYKSQNRALQYKVVNYNHEIVDYKTYLTGYVWNTDSVSIKILNSYIDSREENKRTLLFSLQYNGFIYNHGDDTYAVNQEGMISDFGEENKAHVFFAKHHFHGYLLPKYAQVVNPDVVLLQAQEAIYARSAYMEDYKIKSEDYLNAKRKESIETLVALELGATVISVVDSVNWSYSSYVNQDKIVFPELNVRNKE